MLASGTEDAAMIKSVCMRALYLINYVYTKMRYMKVLFDNARNRSCLVVFNTITCPIEIVGTYNASMPNGKYAILRTWNLG